MGEVFDPKNLRELMQRSNLSAQELATAVDMPVGTLNAYLRGKHNPGLRPLLVLADFFAVPLDFLVGRCDEELADNIINNYEGYFMKLRRAPYEAYLVNRKESAFTDRDIVLKGPDPWPYGLLRAAFGPEAPCELVDAEREAEILEVVETGLNPEQASCVLAYYRDGFTMEQICEQRGCCRENVRQILAKSLRTLRHGIHANILRYGKKIAYEQSDLAKKQCELDQQRSELAVKFIQLQAKCDKLQRIQDKLGSYPPEDISGELKDCGVASNCSVMKIEKLDLSVRAFLCLKRAGYDTVADVVKVLENDPESLVRIRNMGRKSYNEVLQKINELTGMDFG